MREVDMNTNRIARIGGWTAVAAGILGAAAGITLLAVAPQVSPDVFSYPFTSGGFAAIQSAFFIHHLAMAFALAAFWRAGLAGAGRFATVAAWASVGVMLLLAVQELVAILAADAPHPSPTTDIIEGAYGMISLALGLTLVLYGIAAARARVLTGAGRWALTIVGAYLFVPLTPAIFAGFVAGRIAITVWLLLFAWWGLVMIRWADAAARRRMPVVDVRRTAVASDSVGGAS